MNVGDTAYLTATLCPEYADNKAVLWSSSNPNVVSVDNSGHIQANMEGRATITVTMANGNYCASSEITVQRLKIYQTKTSFRYDENCNLPEDLQYNDISEDDLKAMDWINWADFVGTTPEDFYNTWMFICTAIFAEPPLEMVIIDMINHFMSGEGSNYSNPILTQKVAEHDSTINYVNSIKSCIDSLMCQYDKDICALKYEAENRDSNPLVDMMREKEIYAPVYDDLDDTILASSGLRICVDSLWGNQIEVKSYNKTGNCYSGTLVFTLYDHFGLDAADVEKFGFLRGFKAWYILQHNKEYNGAYKPFVTVIQFEVPFSGTI